MTSYQFFTLLYLIILTGMNTDPDTKDYSSLLKIALAGIIAGLLTLMSLTP